MRRLGSAAGTLPGGDTSSVGPPAAAAPAPSMAPAAAPPPPGYGGGASIEGDDYRDLFRAPMAGAAAAKYETSGRGRDDERNPPRFRAAVEAERWRAKLSGDAYGKGSSGRDELQYNQRQQADWARERLLGSAPPSVEEMEEEEEESRTQKVVGQAWVPSSSVWVDTTAIDRCEATRAHTHSIMSARMPRVHAPWAGGEQVRRVRAC